MKLDEPAFRACLAHRMALGLVALLATVIPTGAAGQTPDTLQVVAGEEYAAGELEETVLGADYRSLWTTPIRVPVLSLDEFAGGLTPVERGGGQQTRSLRLRGGDGREYNFRSVQKFIGRGLPPDLRGTRVDAFLQDQVSSLHPAATAVATQLVEAASLLHPRPRLVVLPDTPELGEFRDEYGGLLGWIELHANEAEDESPDFGDAAEVDGTEDVLVDVRDSPLHRFDARTYLRERLLSLLIGDWDRHAGQYRWARYDSAGVSTWVPVPEDRDYAFSDYDGLLLRLAGPFFPQATAYGEEYPADLTTLTRSSAPMDRRLLGGLGWDDWQEITTSLLSALPDSVIDRAVGAMPLGYQEISATELARILRARRDALPTAARRYYLQLAEAAELHATNGAERVDIVRGADGTVRVSLVPVEMEDSHPTVTERIFLPEETDEIRLYLYGGDDRVEVRGDARSSPLVRVVGGEGADSLIDLSRVRGPGFRTAFHDAEGANVFSAGSEALIDRSPFQDPLWIPGEVRPPHDWGEELTYFTPWAAYEGPQGVMIGGGPQWVGRGFRRFPFAGRLRLRGMYGYRTGDFGLDGLAEFAGIGSAPDLSLHARWSDLEHFRFHGLGNLSPPAEMVGEEIVHVSQMLFEARARYRLQSEVELSVGPRFEHLRRQRNGTLDLQGAPLREYGKVGLAGEIAIDTRAGERWDEGGFRLDMTGEAYPAAWDLTEPFGRAGVEAAVYARVPGRSVLAGRAGGGRLIGRAPIPEHPSLGGSTTLRGFASERFRGEATAYGGLELRTFLARVNPFVRGDLGVLLFADAGRVYHRSDEGDAWQTARGVGLWVHTLGRSFSATYARGEEHRVYLKMGMPY